MKKSTAIRAIALAALAACAAGANANGVAYYPGFDFDAAYLVDWNTAKHTARVTLREGSSAGTYTDDGTQRIVTLAAPIVDSGIDYDECFEEVTQTTTTTQLVFRPAGAPKKGTAQVVPIGTITTVGGCAPGTVPFGSPTDAGTTVSRLDMTLRASTADLGYGVQLAGMTETPMSGVAYATEVVQETAVFDAGGNVSSFLESGDIVSSTNVNGWIVVSFPDGHQSGFTRLTQDTATGIEAWLAAPWVNNAPAAVHNLLMTKADGSGGWAGTKGAARNWFESIFADSDSLPYFDLYRDRSGAFVHVSPVDGSVQSTEPTTWAFEGANLQIQRSFDWSSGFRQRTWVPLANHGKLHFVLEHEDVYDADGNFIGNSILPRVNYYADQGPSTKPTALARAVVAAKPPVLAHQVKP